MAGCRLTAYRFEPDKSGLSARIVFGREISHSLDEKWGETYAEKGKTT